MRTQRIAPSQHGDAPTPIAMMSKKMVKSKPSSIQPNAPANQANF
jgi:hypothetical protein